LWFEEFLSQISAKFVNLPAAQVDVEIESGLQRLCECLDVERSTRFDYLQPEGELRVTHSGAVHGIDPVPRVLAKDHWPEALERILSGKLWMFSRVEELPAQAALEKDYYTRIGLKSSLGIPLEVGGSIVGALTINAFRTERSWSDKLIKRLRLVGEIFANALQRKRAEESLESAFREIQQLQRQLTMENLYLREEVNLIEKHKGIVGQSEGIKRVLSHVEQVARTESTVLILGETGTGKELIARAIHEMSLRKGRALVKVNCGGFPSTLIESELFGREKGAFTGALSRQIGRFETADGSTIFLDEVGELPVALQIKLIRILQDGEFERLGSSRTIRVDCRVIAATNRDLAKAVQAGEFRQDLYYRLNVFPIHVPPLRNRQEDIPELVWFYVKEFGERMGKRIQTIPQRSMEALKRYSWPGNVRELMNVIERSMILSRGATLHLAVPGTGVAASFEGMTLQEVEKIHILGTLKETGWRISGNKGAADRLGLKPTTLEYRMKKLGIRRPT